MKTVIMAGGRGTRVSSIYSTIPKPMIPLAGKPVLKHQIEKLISSNLKDIIIVTGFLSEKIENYFDNGKKFNCNISYFRETEPLGSAGAIFKIKDLLKDDNFFVINGDIIFDIDFSRIIDFHKNNNALCTIASHPNSHPFDSSLLVTDENNAVVEWLPKDAPRTYYNNLVNAGIHLFSPAVFDTVKPAEDALNMDKNVLIPLISTGRLFSYKTPEYIKDMGTPERIAQVSRDIETHILEKRNLKNKQRAVFLDRDGTINVENGFITKPAQFELVENAGQAVKKINDAGFLAIVITNQPVIARGDCTTGELNDVHKKMETELGKEGAYLTDIFYCPHHPDKGFAGERTEYKIECDCRKPKPGLILRAAKKYNIDLEKSFFLGDSERDKEAAIAAGCTPFLIEKKFSLLNCVDRCLAV